MQKRGSQKGIVFKNVPIIIERNDIQLGVKTLRKKWNIPVKGFTKNKDYFNWLERLTTQQLPENQTSSQYSLFLNDVNNFCKSIQIPPHWASFFIRYIPTGNVKEEIKLRSGKTYNTPLIKIISNVERGNKIRLEFGANTTLEDVKAIWIEIKTIQKSLPEYDNTRQRQEKKMKLTKHLIKQLNKGKKPKEIYESLPFSFGNPNEHAVSKTLQRTKKLIKRQ